MNSKAVVQKAHDAEWVKWRCGQGCHVVGQFQPDGTTRRMHPCSLFSRSDAQTLCLAVVELSFFFGLGVARDMLPVEEFVSYVSG